MDYRRKFDKRWELPDLKRNYCETLDISDDAIAVDKSKVEEDPRLVNWQKWLCKHEKQYRAIETLGCRNRLEILMNSCEQIRPQMRLRTLMDYSTYSMPKIPDKYQSELDIWKLPKLLSARGNFFLPDIRPAMDKEKLNQLSLLEYIDVPTAIRREKKLLPSERNYQGKQKPQLKSTRKEIVDNIQQLESYVPKMDKLVVLGSSLNQARKKKCTAGISKISRIPIISFTDEEIDHDLLKSPRNLESENAQVIIILSINNVEIKRDARSSTDGSSENIDPLTWTLKFESTSGKRCRNYLHFINKGTSAITYQWRKANVTSDVVPLLFHASAAFFFNKNKGLILPGQKMEFPIWFHTSTIGVSTESWYILTEPCVSVQPLLIRLCGQSISKATDTSPTDIDAYLDRCIRDSTIREVLNDILCNLRSPKPPETSYCSLFLERDLFEARNPSHFYHSNTIDKMRQLYHRAMSSDNPQWNLSISTLRRNLLQMKNIDRRDNMLSQFSDMCQQCLKPCLYNAIGNTKLTAVYNIFCTMVDRIEEQSEYIKQNCILKPSSFVVQVQALRNGASIVSALHKVQSPRIPNPNHSPKSIYREEKTSFTISSNSKLQLYQEVFFVYVYECLIEMVEQICVVIDSLNNLNEYEY